jgi:hypothetical protein
MGAHDAPACVQCHGTVRSPTRKGPPCGLTFFDVGLHAAALLEDADQVQDEQQDNQPNYSANAEIHASFFRCEGASPSTEVGLAVTPRA